MTAGHYGAEAPAQLACLQCGQPPRRDDVMSWWACPCGVWFTDEDLARQGEDR